MTWKSSVLGPMTTLQVRQTAFGWKCRDVDQILARNMLQVLITIKLRPLQKNADPDRNIK